MQSAPKHGGTGVHRTRSARETWARLRPILTAIGITRVADITGLDRLGIPVFSCVRPVAARFGVTVTCGKGLRAVDAVVGAVMEAIEYRVSEPDPERSVVARAGDLDGEVIDPRMLIVPPWVRDVEAKHYAWVEGWDLLHDEPVWVPAAAVYSEDVPGDFLFETNTNGLAAGNTMEEAIAHALAELVERDACSIATHRLELGDNGGGAEDGDARYPSLELSTIPPTCQALVDRFAREGIEVFIRDFTSDLGIATFNVACFETHSDRCLAHGGSGTHPVAEIALLRALTEAAQSRAADIQGSREDLSVLRRRALHEVDRRRWIFRTTAARPFTAVPDHRHDDVRDDIDFLLARIRALGMTRAVAIDLTDPTLGIPVMKLVVPGLEVAEIDSWRGGPRLPWPGREGLA